MTGMFEGLRVLELGQYVAVPYCAELFAHGGADVIKVEPTTGDETRFNSAIVPGEGRQYIIKARGKRGIPIDLGSDAGRALARRLALSCDVVLSNMRPGLLERLGLDYATLSAEEPRIIVGEVSGYGSTGPFATRASLDIAVQADSGLMASMPGYDGDRPVRHEAFFSDYMAGTMLAFGVTAALRMRDQTGRGQRVETTLMQAALALQHGTASVFDAVDLWKHEFAAWVETDRPPLAEAAARRSDALAGDLFHYNTYETADGAVAIGAPGRLGARLLAIAGVADPRGEPAWTEADDPRPLIAALTAEVRRRLRARRTDELVAELEAAGVPSARVRFLEETLLDPASAEAGWVYTADHPAVGPMTMPTAPLRFSAGDYAAASASPAFGEHVDEVLGELGLSVDEIAKLLADGVVARTLPR
jgi:formyl-CoA transferase